MADIPPTPPPLQVKFAELLVELHAVNETAREIAEMLVPDPVPVPVVDLRVVATTSSSVTVAWSTEPDAAADAPTLTAVVVGRDGTDVHGSPEWESRPLPVEQDRFVFSSLRPDTDYRIHIRDAAAGADGPRLDEVLAHTARTPVTVPGVHGPHALADGWVTSEVVLASDDFNGAALDTSRWNRYLDPGSQHGNRQPDQIRLVDDPAAMGGRALLIESTSDGKTGGMANVGSLRFGRWSGRVRVEGDDPRCHQVLLTWPDAENWKDGGGEIDYCEGSGGGVDAVQFFLHYGRAVNGVTQQTQARTECKVRGYLWFEMEWTDRYVAGWCEGKEWFRDTNPAHFNYPAFGKHHGTIQLDLFRDGKPLRPTRMYVDSFHLYRWSGSVAG